MPKMIKKDEGIIISSYENDDTSLIINVLTNQEIMSLRVKGVKKTGSKTLKYTFPLTKISFNYSDGAYKTLTEAFIIDNYNKIKDDIDKYYYAEIILELLNYFKMSIDNYKTLYPFLNKLLDMLKDTNSPRSISYIFMIKFLYLLGLAPLFKNCAKCNKKIDYGYFSTNDAGLLCEEDAKKTYQILDLNNSLMIKKIYYTKINDMDEEFLKQINLDIIEDVMVKYYLKHAEFTSRVRKIKKIITD